MKRRFSLEDIQRSVKTNTDTWWTVIVTDPISIRLLFLISNNTSITPNEISLVAILLVCVSAFCFTRGSYIWLVAGALIWQGSYVLDCVDGKLARLKNMETKIGYLLEAFHTQIECSICPIALAYGQFIRTKDFTYIILLSIALIVFNIYFFIAIMPKKTKNIQFATETINVHANEKKNIVYILAKKYLQTKEKIKQHRLNPLPTGTEATVTLCVIAPLLFQIKAGLILYILLYLFVLTYTNIFHCFVRYSFS